MTWTGPNDAPLTTKAERLAKLKAKGEAMKPRTGPVSESAKHQLKFLGQELKRPGESVAELYIRALKKLKEMEVLIWGDTFK